MDSSRAISLWTALCSFVVVFPLARSNHNGTECPTLHVPFYGVLVHNGTWLTSDQPEWIENTTVTLQCDRGYELVDTVGESAGGSLNVTCGENAKWSDDSGNYTCSRVNCGLPPAVANATVSLSSPSATDFGSTATYTCSQGYQLSGAATVLCQSGSNWTAPPICTAITTCGDPPAISSGNYTWSVGDPTPIGTTVIYSCDSGHMIDGPNSVVCLGDGTWTPTPSCDAITTCGDPPAISSGNYTWSVGDPTPIGTTVIYSCDSGHMIDGPNSVVCLGNGTWTATPSCDAEAALSQTQILIIEGAISVAIILFLCVLLTCACCYIYTAKIRQRKYVEDEEALASSGAFTLSNPLVGVKDEDAAGNPLYLTPDELNEFEQQH